MVRNINIEGIVDELPESGFSNSVPILKNEKILGLSALFIIFLFSIDWKAILATLPLHVIGIDVWMALALILIVFLRFVLIIIKPPIGANVINGFYASPQNKEAFFWDVAGEMFLVSLFALLVWLKNPIVFVFASLFLITRFKKFQKTDCDYCYPQRYT